jgi:CubicO group peptidase (beta-lactamase class C family)
VSIQQGTVADGAMHPTRIPATFEYCKDGILTASGMEMYSNTNFCLLGLVIEKASGMTYEDYVEKKMFEPLGMTRSMYCNDSENVPRRAYGIS